MVSLSSEVAVPYLDIYTEISTVIVWDGSTEIPENFSVNATDTGSDFTELHLPTVICSSIALVLINLAVVIGNILVLLAVYCERGLRTATNYFIFNLALADLLLGTLVLPFSGTYEVMHAWPFGSVFCDVWAAVDVLCCTASINSLCCISIDRYIGVTRPLKHRLIMTTKRAILICIFVWMLSFLIAVGPLFGWKPKSRNTWECQITDSIDYVLFSTAGSFWIPLVIIIVLYMRIYCEVVARDTGPMGSIRQSSFRGSHGQNGHAGIQLRVHVGSQRSHSGSRGSHGSRGSRGSRNNNRRDNRPRNTQQSQRAVNFNREKKVAKTLGIVVGVFILCWFPFFFLLPLTSACPACKVPEIVFKVVFWLGYCNSFVNPLIYALSNHTFRRAFRKILTCRYWLRRRRRHFRRWSNLSRFTASSTLSSPVVTSSRHSSRRNKSTCVTPEASPMLIDSASPSPAHQATSTSGLLNKQQNGNLFDFKKCDIRDDGLVNNTERHYGTSNGIRVIDQLTNLEDCENMLNRTHSSSSASSRSSGSSTGTSSSEEIYRHSDSMRYRDHVMKGIYKNVTEVKNIKRNTSRTSETTCSCVHITKQNVSRNSSRSSKESDVRYCDVDENQLPPFNMVTSHNNTNMTEDTDGALLRNNTPPDLVSGLLNKITNNNTQENCVDIDTKKEEEDKSSTSNNLNDSKETSV